MDRDAEDANAGRLRFVRGDSLPALASTTHSSPVETLAQGRSVQSVPYYDAQQSRFQNDINEESFERGVDPKVQQPVNYHWSPGPNGLVKKVISAPARGLLDQPRVQQDFRRRGTPSRVPHPTAPPATVYSYAPAPMASVPPPQLIPVMQHNSNPVIVQAPSYPTPTPPLPPVTRLAPVAIPVYVDPAAMGPSGRVERQTIVSQHIPLQVNHYGSVASPPVISTPISTAPSIPTPIRPLASTSATPSTSSGGRPRRKASERRAVPPPVNSRASASAAARAESDELSSELDSPEPEPVPASKRKASESPAFELPSSPRIKKYSKANVVANDDKLDCPHPGCDKKFSQRNGLKYHLKHGRCNVPGTESFVEEMKGKPHVCHLPTCGKRYKNRNGLRYHYEHSGPHGVIGMQLFAEDRHPRPEGHEEEEREGSADGNYSPPPPAVAGPSTVTPSPASKVKKSRSKKQASTAIPLYKVPPTFNDTLLAAQGASAREPLISRLNALLGNIGITEPGSVVVCEFCTADGITGQTFRWVDLEKHLVKHHGISFEKYCSMTKVARAEVKSGLDQLRIIGDFASRSAAATAPGYAVEMLPNPFGGSTPSEISSDADGLAGHYQPAPLPTSASKLPGPGAGSGAGNQVSIGPPPVNVQRCAKCPVVYSGKNAHIVLRTHIRRKHASSSAVAGSPPTRSALALPPLVAPALPPAPSSALVVESDDEDAIGSDDDDAVLFTLPLKTPLAAPATPAAPAAPADPSSIPPTDTPVVVMNGTAAFTPESVAKMDESPSAPQVGTDSLKRKAEDQIAAEEIADLVEPEAKRLKGEVQVSIL